MNKKYRDKKWLKEQFEKYKTPTEVSRNTGYPRTCITRYAIEYEIYKPLYSRDAKIQLNNKYFDDINSPDKAYFLGFITANGNIYVRNKNNGKLIFNLQIKSSDDDIIKKLCSFIEYPLESIRYRTQIRNENSFEIAGIQINDQTFCNSLINKGVVIKETMPNCNGYEVDFIRGFIDGDGFLRKMQCATGERITIGFCSSSLKMIEQISSYIEDTMNIKMNISKGKNVYKCEISSRYKVFKILNRLYYDDCISLDRKNKIAQEIRKEIYDELF